MPSAAYAKILVSVGGGALASGGLTVAAGAAIHLQAESTAGWSGTPAPLWQIYEYPEGWSGPGGWSTDDNGVFFYLGVTPPDFSLPDISLWGKFMLRLTVNGSLVDDSTALSVLSTTGFEDIAFGEANQFDNLRQWTGALKRSLRLFDDAASSAANSTSGGVRAPALVATTANITLSGTQPIDGISVGAGVRVLVKDQTVKSQNGIYLSASGGWSRTSDANTSALVAGNISVSVQRGTANIGKTFVLVTQPPITLETTSLRWIETSPTVDARLLAANDDTTDDLANLQAAFLVAPEVVYTGSSGYKILTSGTVGTAASVHRFPAGTSTIDVGAGVTLTLRGEVKGPFRQLFTGAGTVLAPDMLSVKAAWFGALGNSDSYDDAPGITKASAAFTAHGGGTVLFHRPPNGYFALLSQAQIGVAGVATQGVRWSFSRRNFSPASSGAFAVYADIKVLADLGAGNAAIVNRGASRTDLGDANIDCNGLCDWGIQFAAPLTSSPGVDQSSITSWQCEYSGTIRNAREGQILSGEALFEASVSGTAFTVVGSGSIPGHPLLAGHKIFLTKILGSYALPGGFSQTLIYRVVSTTKYGFTLCLDSDGTNTLISATDDGSGRWLVGICDAGDCSQLRIQKAHLAENTIAGVVAQCSFLQHGMNSLGSEIRAWSQGQMAEGGTAVAATIDGSGHTVTTSLQIIDGPAFRHIQNGDAVLLWAATPGTDALPTLLPGDTEYFVIGTTGSGSTRTFQLASKPGGSAIAFGAATGTIHIDALRSPFYHFVLIGGSMRLEKTTTVGARGRIKLLLRPNGSGAAASLGGQFDDDGDCQDWSYLHADNGALASFVTPQNGICTSKIKHQNIWLGAVADAVRWNTPNYSGLDLTGASFGGNIRVGTSAAPIKLGGCRLIADGLAFLPLVVGPDGTPGTVPGAVAAGDWYTSNGIDASAFLPSAGATMGGANGVAPVSGYDNATTLAAAILKAPGPTHLGRGTHEVHTDATVSVREHRHLVGQGIEATTLQLAATSDYGMLIESQVTGVLNTGNRLADMTITAPSATHYALGLKSSTDSSGSGRILAGVEVERVNFNNCAAGAIQPVANNIIVDVLFKHCKFQNSNTTRYLVDLLDPNGTTFSFIDCYFSNNRNAADGVCIRASGDSLHLTNLVVESSGRLIDMLYTANLRWEGGRCENMIGPIVNATGNLPPGYGTVAIQGVMFERGPVLGATPVIIVNGFGLQSISLRNCAFESWRSVDMAIANVSAQDVNVDVGGCTFINCDAGFIAQFLKYAPNTYTSWSNQALHSSFEDTGVAISGATNANPIVIATSAPHGILNGQGVVITGVGGNTAANGTFTATFVDSTHYSIPVAGNGTYTSGGTSSYSFAHVNSGTGGSFARDTSNKLDEDTASFAMTWTAGSTATIEIDSTELSIFAGDTSDVGITFKAWLSSPVHFAVAGATNANPVVITSSAAHGLSTGATVTHAGIGGNTAANGTFAVTVLSPTTYSIPVAGNGAYTSGGTIVCDTGVSLRALWTGSADIANVRLDVDTVPRRFTMRAVAPPGGYTTGTYALFFEQPTPALPSGVTLNIAQVHVEKLPRGAHWVIDRPYVATGSAARTVAAGLSIVGKLQGGRADGATALALALSAPTSTQPATDSVALYPQSTGAILAKTFDAFPTTPGPGYVMTLVPDVQIGIGLGTPTYGRIIRHVATTTSAEVAVPATGLGSPATSFFNAGAGIPSGACIQFDSFVMGHDTSGNVMSIQHKATLKNVGGTISVVGSQTTTALANDTNMAGVTVVWETAFGGFLGIGGPTTSKTVNWTVDITWRQLA